MTAFPTLPEMAFDRYQRQPDTTIIIDADRGSSLTYKALHETNLAWATALHRLGVAPGDTVVTMLPTSFEAYHAWLAVGWLGAIEVPINTQLRGRMLAYEINFSEAQTVVASAEFIQQLADVGADLKSVKRLVVIDSEDVTAELPFEVITSAEFSPGDIDATLFDAPPGRHDICCMIYTSGTTGPPKGVLVPWGQQLRAEGFEPPGWPREGTHYSYLSAAHMSGKSALFTAVGDDRPLILRRSFSVSHFWDDIRKYSCTSTQLWPALIKFLLAQPASARDAENPLQHVWCAPLVPEIDEFKSRFGIAAVTSGYGMTEIGGPLSLQDADQHTWRSCGKVLSGSPGFEVRIVDEFDNPLGPGEVGELIVRADLPWVLNAGYFRMPEETARAWRNGWFHTGDALRYDEEGYFYFVDRLKDCIRRRGENISSFEVEAYVNEHPEVAESAAYGVPSEEGEEDVQIAVVRRDGSELSPEGLLEFLTSRMPRFMLPRFVQFVEELPKTEATGRVRKGQLRELRPASGIWDREASAVRS